VIGFDVDLWFWVIAGITAITDQRPEQVRGAQASPATTPAAIINEHLWSRRRPGGNATPRLFVERRAYLRRVAADGESLCRATSTSCEPGRTPD
jgi:hypothetical protein